MEELLTASQRRTIESAVERCGTCRRLAEMASLLGRKDQDFIDTVDHLQGSGESALRLYHEAKNGTGR